MKLNMNQGIELQGLLLRLKDEKIPIRTAYKFNKLIPILEEELKFYNTEFAKIINQYAQKDENGNPILSEDKTSIQIVRDKTEECQEKINELSNIEFEIDKIFFTIEELDNIKLTILEMRILMPFIKEED